MGKKYIFGLLGIFILWACEYSDLRLKIMNKGKHEIAVEFSSDTIPNGKNKAEFFLREKILIGHEKEFHRFGGKDQWSRFILNSKNRRLNVFVYSIDTIEKYMDMDLIRARRKYEKKISISEEELEAARWVINYR